jgi:hypothetical protein
MSSVSARTAPLVSTLYAEHFEIEHVAASRAINSDGAKRGKVAESIMR